MKKNILSGILIAMVISGCSNQNHTVDNKKSNQLDSNITTTSKVQENKLNNEQLTVQNEIKGMVNFDFTVDNSYRNERYPDSIKILSNEGNYIVQKLDKDNLVSDEYPPFLLIDEKNKAFLVRNKELVPYDSIKEQLAQKTATALNQEIVVKNSFFLNGIGLQMNSKDIEKVLGVSIKKQKSEEDPNKLLSTYKEYIISYYNDKAIYISYSTSDSNYGKKFINNYNGLIYKVNNNIYAFYLDTDKSIMFVSFRDNKYKYDLQYSDGNFINAISTGDYKLVNKSKVVFQ